MLDSDSPTRNDPARAPSEELATAGWVAPAGPAVVDAAQPTHALPDMSTPGPHAPDRVTMPESTENMLAAEPRAGVPRLPPIPGYVVERYVGRGGMGVVYRATHAATGRVVALKLTNPGSLNEELTRERFVREVHALAAIKHPNIVPVYDAGDWHGFPFCTMEFVPGGTLNQHLDRIRVDLRAAVGLMVKVARAVQALHAAGILHRDLKPLNILIGANDEPMVADFGLAKWMGDDSDLTLTGLPVGTRQYMSPEQTRGDKKAYTAACDVWALGVTLYELLTGHRPFSDDGITDVYHCIRTAAPPPMTALSPDVPDPLQAVVSKCLAKKPDDRYATAAAFADDLDKWLRGDTVSVTTAATAPLLTLNPPESAKKPRRNRVAIMAAGVAAAALLTGGIFGIFHGPKADATPQKSIAQRVADGEKVPLTDAEGRPLVTPVKEPGYEAHEGSLGEYGTFECLASGIVGLSHEPLDFPYRVEAEVAVVVEKIVKKKEQKGEEGEGPSILAGIYVGRKTWDGFDQKLESLVWAGISPALGKSLPGAQKIPLTLETSLNLHRWMGQAVVPIPYGQRNHMLWARDGKAEEDIRFATIVIDVSPKAIQARIDGDKLTELACDAYANRMTRSLKDVPIPGFPDFKFTTPCFGSGIGIYCENAKCIVRNLTVSRTDLDQK